MRYLVTARMIRNKAASLLQAIKSGNLGRGSVAGDEYLHNMEQSRLRDDGSVQWVETCFCPTPLEEERSYWEEYFELLSVTDAHNRKNCRHENGTERWACSDCDCTDKLEERLQKSGKSFLVDLENCRATNSA